MCLDVWRIADLEASSLGKVSFKSYMITVAPFARNLLALERPIPDAAQMTTNTSGPKLFVMFRKNCDYSSVCSEMMQDDFLKVFSLDSIQL